MWNFFIKYKIKYKNEIVNLQNRRFFHKLGFYYEKTDYDQMKKYYLMAIKLGHSDSMFNLGYYYKEIEKDYDQMKKYYLMAIELGDSDSMFNLGNYYKEIEKDYEQMKKYYLMAIELGCKYRMNILCKYYQEI